MAPPVQKNHCMKRQEKMDCDTQASPGHSEETDSDEEVVEENFSNYTGVKLIYFEHNYMKNYDVLCEIYGNTNPEAEKLPSATANAENFNIQVPVRRSHRQIAKSESDDVSESVTDKQSSIESHIKSRRGSEGKSKLYMELTSDNTVVVMSSKAVNKSKNENKDLTEDIAVSNNKNESVLQLSPPKNLKKRKTSESKILDEKDNDVLKNKCDAKDFKTMENGDDIKKDNVKYVETKRKRTCSEPSKSELYSSDTSDKDNEMGKNKKLRSLVKPKIPVKTKKGEKLSMDCDMFKKTKRNMSAPTDKMEAIKNDIKNPVLTVKGKRKKKLSLSENLITTGPSKSESKKTPSNEIKESVSKTFSPPSNPIPKPKFKKTPRKESLRLVINEDEPPLFSQPDVMVKVKSEDNTKKEEKNESEEKSPSSQSSNSDVVKNLPQVLDSIPKLELSDSKTPEATPKSFETPSITSIGNSPNSTTEATETASERSVEKDEYKDIDSENSLHIDESVGKFFEDDAENSKSESKENVSFSVTKGKTKEETQFKERKDENVDEMLSANLHQTVKDNVDDPDDDKPIAERKPRRTIKKKEFFEDITSRSSTQTKKSAGRQKGADKKSNEDESKQEKRKSSSKTEVDSEESSEDDPTKLWCICRQPHNDRFMIQCDHCEDWFHGSCVGVSRQQGRKLEKLKKEWICPNCIKKDAENVKIEDSAEKMIELEEKNIKPEKDSIDDEKGCVMKNAQAPSRKDKVVDKISKTVQKSNQDIPVSLPLSSTSSPASGPKNDKAPIISPISKRSFNIKNQRLQITKNAESFKKGLKEPIKRKQTCVSCQTVALVNSCYCSDKCLEKHAADCLAIMREGKEGLKGSDFDSQKIVVLDRVKGNVITGDNAPSAANIVSWLKENPSFMIACSSSASINTKTTLQRKEGDSASSAKDKKEASDESKATVRLNVRKTLKNILMDRCKNADDIQLPEEEIRRIAVKIEEELNFLFKDNSFKYRAKYRSLMFNIKDPRNQGLFRKILKGNIPPDKLVRMSPEELASLELAKWREQENQHLLDMIKRVQLEQQSGSGLLLKKTHKGEVEIEDDFVFDTTTDDIPKTASKSFSGELAEIEKPEPDKEVVKDTTHHHRSHLFDLNCKICTGKILPPPVEDNTPKKVRVAHSISVDLSSPATLDPVEKTVSRIVDGKSPLSSTGDDSMDQEPTSTVSIGSPETPMRYSPESDTATKAATSVWKGFIFMQDVAKFVTSAYKVSGQTEYLNTDVPDTILVCGRIIPDQVWDYLGKIKQSGNKELIIIRFQAANDEEAVTYNSFYSYLSSRKRYGVVSNYSKKIKDFYILPLAATSPVPIVLMPFDGPGLPSPRPHLLLGVIVCHKVKQACPSVLKKEKCKDDSEQLDGSYTPPLETRSYTPPLPALQTDSSVNVIPDTMYSPSMDLKSVSPSEESDVTQNSITSSADVKNKTDPEIYEPSYTPPLQILSSDSPKERDDDKPYDPEQDILNIGNECKDSILIPKEVDEKHAATENLEKHKKLLDALTRQVEETDRQVNALKQLISHPDDSDAEYHSPSTQSLDINSVAATGMSSFLDLPENLQDILNVVREKSLDKEASPANKGDVDMRINNLFNKSFNNSTYQSLNETNKIINPKEKNSSCSTTPPLDENDESSTSLIRPSDPRIKLRTSFQDSPFSEESANVPLSNMSVSELVQRAEKELAEIEALEKAQTTTQNVSPSHEKLSTSNLDKISPTCWKEFKEPPPPGIELSDLASQDSTYSSKTVASTSDNSLPSSYSSPLVQEAQQSGSHFPPPSLSSTFPPPLPPGFSIQTPPPNLKNFPPPNVIATSFPPPPLPVVTKASDANSMSDTWPTWNIPPQQSKDNTWQNRVPQWDDNWKNAPESASVDCSESSSHYYPPGTSDFHKEPFYRGESSTEGRWNRPSRFGRNNWHKRPLRGGRWRGRRGSFYFNKNQRN